MKIKKLVGEKYFHIDNGGISFEVTSTDFGPVVRISSSHFGTNIHTQVFHVSIKVLEDLAELFTNASKYEDYDYPYIYAVKSRELAETGCGSNVCCGGDCHKDD